MIASLIAGLLAAATPSLSIHVEGDGYLRLAKEGRVVYATSAKLTVEDGQLSTGGATFLPTIRVPSGCDGFDIDLDGNLTVKSGAGKSVIGRIVLALFPANSSLVPDGDFLTASSRPRLGNPGDDTNGVIRVDGAAKAQTESKTNSAPPKTSTTKPPTYSAPVVKTGSKPSKPGAVEITISAQSAVSGESFKLGEIADIKADPNVAAELSEVDMGRSPILGVERGLDTAFVMMKLRMAKFKADTFSVLVPPGARVTRKGQTITFADFVDTAKNAAKTTLGIDLPLTCNGSMTDFEAPLGDLQLVAENCIKTANAISVTVSVKVDGRRINSRTISLVPDTASAGVKAGATVKILARLKGATVEMTGRAQQSGWVGQTITVVTETGATQSATVTGANTVEVKL